MFIKVITSLGTHWVNVEDISSVTVQSTSVLVYTSSGQPYSVYKIEGENAENFLVNLPKIE